MLSDDTKDNERTGANGCRILAVFDLTGGKSGAHFSQGVVSPTITRGRASVSDVHAVVMKGESDR